MESLGINGDANMESLVINGDNVLKPMVVSSRHTRPGHSSFSTALSASVSVIDFLRV